MQSAFVTFRLEKAMKANQKVPQGNGHLVISATFYGPPLATSITQSISIFKAK